MLRVKEAVRQTSSKRLYNKEAQRGCITKRLKESVWQRGELRRNSETAKLVQPEQRGQFIAVIEIFKWDILLNEENEENAVDMELYKQYLIKKNSINTNSRNDVSVSYTAENLRHQHCVLSSKGIVCKLSGSSAAASLSLVQALGPLVLKPKSPALNMDCMEKLFSRIGSLQRFPIDCCSNGMNSKRCFKSDLSRTRISVLDMVVNPFMVMVLNVRVSTYTSTYPIESVLIIASVWLQQMEMV